MSKKKSPKSVQSGMFAHTAHAQEHVDIREGRLRECVGDKKPTADQYEVAPCVLCGELKSFHELTIEHVPQQREQSIFGPSCWKLLTCYPCNNAPGETYEKVASKQVGAVKEQPSAFEVAVNSCPNHGYASVQKTRTGLLVTHSEIERKLTDLKSGFLLAASVLGLSWALSAELAPIRHTIRTGNPLDDRFGLLVGVDIDKLINVMQDGMLSRSQIIEVAKPWPCVIVRHESGRAAMFPMPGFPVVPARLSGVVQSRSFPWPKLATGVQGIQKVFEAGYLFHRDFCCPYPLPKSSRG